MLRRVLYVLLATVGCAAAGEIEIKLTKDGLQSLRYKGVEYCEPTRCGELGFTGGTGHGNQWEPGVTDEHQNTTTFATRPTAKKVDGNTITHTFQWGTIAATYEVKDADLYVTAVLTNTGKQTIGWWKANLLQLNQRLVFDKQPWGKVMPYGYTPNMHWDHHWRMWGLRGDGFAHWNFCDPHVYWWVDKAKPFDKQPIKIMFADLTAHWQTGVYRERTRSGYAWPVVASADGDPKSPRSRVPAGESDTVKVVIRFRPATASAVEECRDGYEAWGRRDPRTVEWTDRRPIGKYFGCRGNNMGGTNTNGWMADKSVDINSAAGRKAFAKKLLAEIDRTIEVLNDADAQGIIWWDLEGARNPHPVTYIGDPRVLDPEHPLHNKFVPELDTEVVYKNKRMKLVDACFKKFADAGLRTGVTIRPQQVVFTNGKIKQTNQRGKQGEILLAKVKYARDRWGCTIFYVDSIDDWFGNWWLENVVKEHNDILLMPEWGRTRTYRHASAFSYTKFTRFTKGVPLETQAAWPDAFCCMSNIQFDKYYDDVVEAVKRGNVITFNAWYNSAEKKHAKEIYAKLGVKHTPRVKDLELEAQTDKVLKVQLKGSDEDKDKISFEILSPPEHGKLKVVDAKRGRVLYRSDTGFTGQDNFSFRALDKTGLSSRRGEVIISVE